MKPILENCPQLKDFDCTFLHLLLYNLLSIISDMACFKM